MDMRTKSVYAFSRVPFRDGPKPAERAKALSNRQSMACKRRAANKRIEETRAAFALKNLEMN